MENDGVHGLRFLFRRGGPGSAGADLVAAADRVRPDCRSRGADVEHCGGPTESPYVNRAEPAPASAMSISLMPMNGAIRPPSP